MSVYAPAFASFDTFVERYMREMNAPGMIFVQADRDAVQRASSFGLGDVEHAMPVASDALFEIGSISKSFLAICLLQLRAEGKLDLDKPIHDYLPWWRIASSHAPITTHHMLTHATGLPGNPPVFLSDPAAQHRAANPPGSYFHYSNMVFEALGYLAWTLDGRPLADMLRKRIFEPLGMTQSEPAITLGQRARMVRNYYAFQSDRPYPRQGRLAEAPALVFTNGAGCICSTARDMGLYIRMLANRGAGPNGRLLSEEGFKLFSRPHIKAEEFGPTASYGYGIAVDVEDGHTILKHTGGMLAFASAIRVDLDDGVGAFASINAMQGYRPTAVVDHAVRIMRAQRARKPLPLPPPPPADTAHIDKASTFAGVYRSTDGRTLEFVADGERLFLLHAGQRLAVDSGDGLMLVQHADFSQFPFLFGRADSKIPKSPVVEVSWGGDWYVNAAYKGPRQFSTPPQWTAYAGHYRNENPWIGSFHVLIVKDRLTIDGMVALEPASDGEFLVRDEANSPEWIRFTDIVNGKTMRAKISGEDVWRIMDA